MKCANCGYEGQTSEERQDQIMQVLFDAREAGKPAPSIRELMKAIGVSQGTIEHHLRALTYDPENGNPNGPVQRTPKIARGLELRITRKKWNAIPLDERNAYMKGRA